MKNKHFEYGKGSFSEAKSMLSHERQYVFCHQVVCFHPQKYVFSSKKVNVYTSKVALQRHKHPLQTDNLLVFHLLCGSFLPFLFYFKCKYFAILLSIRQKADFFSVLFDRPLLQAERSDSQAVGKSKCHFDTSHLRIRYFIGERPVLRTKNLPKTDWSEKPSSSAISFTSLSAHSNSLRASALSSSDMGKQTVCPVILRTMRERQVVEMYRRSAQKPMLCCSRQ